MKIEIKNSKSKPSAIKPLFDYFLSLDETPQWEYYGLRVEIDPTIDFKGNDALIRWTNLNEGFNDKLIVNSLDEFKSQFTLVNA